MSDSAMIWLIFAGVLCLICPQAYSQDEAAADTSVTQFSLILAYDKAFRDHFDGDVVAIKAAAEAVKFKTQPILSPLKIQFVDPSEVVDFSEFYGPDLQLSQVSNSLLGTEYDKYHVSVLAVSADARMSYARSYLLNTSPSKKVSITPYNPANVDAAAQELADNIASALGILDLSCNSLASDCATTRLTQVTTEKRELDPVSFSEEPQWSSWGPFSECSASCGGGTRSRNRSCIGTGCEGISTETVSCNTEECVCVADPPAVPNMATSSFSGIRIVGTVITYSCSDGTTAFDVTCQNDRTWSSVQLVCPTGECSEEPPSPTIYDESDYDGVKPSAPGTTVTYTCPGSGSVEKIQSTCSAGKWSDVSNCKGCYAHPTSPTDPGVTSDYVDNGLSKPFSPTGTIITFTCPVSDAKLTTTCEEGGTWSVPEQCPRGCTSRPPAPTYEGVTSDFSGNSFIIKDTVVTYTCPDSDEQKTTTCNGDDQWTPVEECPIQGCKKDGYELIDGACFKLIDNTKKYSWLEAAVICEKEGTQLASCLSKEQEGYAMRLADDGNGLYIGEGSALMGNTNSQAVNMDGSPLAYEPNTDGTPRFSTCVNCEAVYYDNSGKRQFREGTSQSHLKILCKYVPGKPDDCRNRSNPRFFEKPCMTSM